MVVAPAPPDYSPEFDRRLGAELALMAPPCDRVEAPRDCSAAARVIVDADAVFAALRRLEAGLR